MMRLMKIDASEHDLKEMFDSIDIDCSGQIAWAEMKLDFDKCNTCSLF